MAQIKFSKRALKNYRSQNMQMSHQELAACSGISVRSIARREDLNEPDLIDEEELAGVVVDDARASAVKVLRYS